MKKQGLIIIAILLFAASASAQHSIGIKTGLGVSNVKTPALIHNLDLLDPLHSFEGGIVYEYAFSPNISLRSGANYVRTGFQIQESISPTIFGIDIPLGGTVRTAIHNVEIPVMIKVQASSGNLKPYAALGPHITFASSGNLSLHSNVFIDVQLLNTPINLESINYQRTDFGLSGLAGLAYDMGNTSVFIEGHYKTGLSDLYRPNFIDTNIRNQGYGVSAGFQYTL